MQVDCKGIHVCIVDQRVRFFGYIYQKHEPRDSKTVPANPRLFKCSLCGNATCSSIKHEKIIELFQKCHNDHPYGKFFGECTDLKIKLDKCFRQEKAVKRKANFEESKKLKERLQAYRKETAAET